MCFVSLTPSNVCSLFFININSDTRMSTHFYEHMHAHPIFMSIFERLSQFDLEIHNIDHQECLTVDRNIISH
jgi:hypothetical protein